MKPEELTGLFKNTFGSIVDINGPTREVLRFLHETGIAYLDIQEGKINIGSETTIKTNFKRTSNAGSIITFEINDESAFCPFFKDKIFIQDQIIKVTTTLADPDKTGQLNSYATINEVILCYQTMTGLKDAIIKIKQAYDLEVIDLTGISSQYEGFDDMRKAYESSKKNNGVTPHAVPGIQTQEF